MRILIVDDNPLPANRIRSILSAEPDMSFLVISDAELAHTLVEYGLPVDIALVDLRLGPAEEKQDAGSDGLAVCQKLRQLVPDAVIVGYSSSFTVENEENDALKHKFTSMGANIVCALDHLTLTPASELRYEFEMARAQGALSIEKLAKPKLFIGSSTEALKIANKLQEGLAYENFQVEVWNQTSFGLGDLTLEALEKAIRKYKYAIFVFSADDELYSRGEKKHVARDNVIFEAGLFMGSLGRSRTFVVIDRNNNVSLPSDLAGLTLADFDSSMENLSAALGPACEKIRDAIQKVQSADPLR